MLDVNLDVEFDNKARIESLPEAHKLFKEAFGTNVKVTDVLRYAATVQEKKGSYIGFLFHTVPIE